MYPNILERILDLQSLTRRHSSWKGSNL